MALMRDELAALREDFALNQLACVNARGNQHGSCAEGTRTHLLDKLDHLRHG